VVTNSGSATAATYTFYRSSDGGATFEFMSAQNFAGFLGTFYNGRNSVEGVRTRPYPFIAADNSYGPYRGRFYLAYSTNNPAGSGNKPDLYCRYSSDQGVTWSAGVIINDDLNSQNNHQWMPAIWCDKGTGRLYAKWYDSRNSPASDSTDVYASYSDDGGVTWATNQKLTNRKFRTNCATCGGGGDPRYQGDYDAIASNKNGAMAVWTDYRNGNFGSFTGYFPDFAMLTSLTADTLGLTDSVNVVVKIPSVKLYSKYVKFTVSVSPSANFTLSFVGNRDSQTSYPDSVTLRIRANNVPQGVYNVTVTGSGPAGAAVHKRIIRISALPALVTVLQPNGGEQMFVGTTYPINWVRNLVDTVKIEYSTNSGSSWILITAGVPASPSPIIHQKLRALHLDGASETSTLATYNWNVPNTPSASCLVRISDKLNPAVFDVSDAVFSIVAAPAPRWTGQTSGTGINFYSVSVVDTNVAWAAGDSGRVYRTVNGGGAWTPRTAVTNPVSSIYAISSSIALMASNAANNARIMRTVSGGLGWITAYQDTSAGAYIDAIKMFDANNGYAVGDPVGGRWTLLRTTDAGATWVKRDTLPQAGSEFGWGNSMSWIGNQYGWFGTNNSRVYRTTNGGANWSPAATAFTNSYAVSFATNQVGIAGGNGVARSTNGGALWTNTPAQPPTATFGTV
ncbi:MAG: exo-alpha-sialidase, partial [Bacteroidota bacterium]